MKMSTTITNVNKIIPKDRRSRVRLPRTAAAFFSANNLAIANAPPFTANSMLYLLCFPSSWNLKLSGTFFSSGDIIEILRLRIFFGVAGETLASMLQFAQVLSDVRAKGPRQYEGTLFC